MLTTMKNNLLGKNFLSCSYGFPVKIFSNPGVHYVCMYVCMYVCIYVCMSIYIYIYIYIRFNSEEILNCEIHTHTIFRPYPLPNNNLTISWRNIMAEYRHKHKNKRRSIYDRRFQNFYFSRVYTEKSVPRRTQTLLHIPHNTNTFSSKHLLIH